MELYLKRSGSDPLFALGARSFKVRELARKLTELKKELNIILDAIY